MPGLLDVPQWLVIAFVATWGIGILGVAALAVPLMRGQRRVVVSDPHEEAIFDVVRARRWDFTAA